MFLILLWASWVRQGDTATKESLQINGTAYNLISVLKVKTKIPKYQRFTPADLQTKKKTNHQKATPNQPQKTTASRKVLIIFYLTAVYCGVFLKVWQLSSSPLAFPFSCTSL